MGCDLISGRSMEECLTGRAGIKTLYFTKFNDFDALTGVTESGGEITSLGADPITLHRYDLGSNVGNFDEALTTSEDNGVSFVTQTITLSLFNIKPADLANLNNLKRGRWTIWALDFQDKIRIFGRTRGCVASGGSDMSGVASGDKKGLDIILTATENNYSLFMADYTADPFDNFANVTVMPTYGSRMFYVRPSGGSYGLEDGTSYANAWDGFTNIEWGSPGVKAGDTLYICGTHTEVFTVGTSGESGNPILIRGDYAGDAGVIDSEDTRSVGIQISSRNYITLSAISSIDADVSCVNIEGTSAGIITDGLIVTGSANQGLQHLDTAEATHIDIVATGNADDGISGHGDAVITVTRGTIHSNDEGLNVVGSVHLTATDVDFSTGNTTYDVRTRQGTTPGSVWIDITGSTIPGDIMADLDSKIILRDCTVEGVTQVVSTGTMSYLEAYDSVLNGEFQSQGKSTTIFDSCLVKDWGSGVEGICTLTECVVTGRIIHVFSGAAMVFNRTLFDMSAVAAHNIEVDTGATAEFHYCVMKGMQASRFFLLLDSTGTAVVDNCTFVGASNVGRGIFARPDTTINNCIFTDLDVGYLRQDNTSVLNNCCFFDNNTDITGTVTENNPQTGDPELADPGNNDFTLGGTSSCLANGTDLGGAKDTGIDTATWGNLTTDIPIVATKDQAASWDIGAYIS